MKLADLQNNPDFAKQERAVQEGIINKIDPQFGKLDFDVKEGIISKLTAGTPDPIAQEAAQKFPDRPSDLPPVAPVAPPSQQPTLTGGVQFNGQTYQDPYNAKIQAPQYSPLQNIGHAIQGGLAGIGKGLVPLDRVDNPLTPESDNIYDGQYSYNPIGQAAETATRLPTTLATNVIGQIFGGKAFPDAYAGIQAFGQNRDAQDAALKAGDWEAQRRLANTAMTTPLAAMGLTHLTQAIPGHIGQSLPAKMISGGVAGYGQDLAMSGLDQLAQTGKIDPRTLNYAPSLGTLLGAGLPGASAALKSAKKANVGPRVGRGVAWARERFKQKYGQPHPEIEPPANDQQALDAIYLKPPEMIDITPQKKPVLNLPSQAKPARLPMEAHVRYEEIPQQEAKKSFTDEELDSLVHYRRAGTSEKINEYLRGRKQEKYEYEPPEVYHRHTVDHLVTRDLDEAIKKNKAARDIKVYRGMALTKDNLRDVIETLEKGKSTHQFVSTSTEESTAKLFSTPTWFEGNDYAQNPHKYENQRFLKMDITVKKGTEYLDMIEHISPKNRNYNAAEEKEILLGRDTRFKVTEIKEDGNYVTIKAETIPQQEVKQDVRLREPEPVGMEPSPLPVSDPIPGSGNRDEALPLPNPENSERLNAGSPSPEPQTETAPVKPEPPKQAVATATAAPRKATRHGSVTLQKVEHLTAEQKARLSESDYETTTDKKRADQAEKSLKDDPNQFYKNLKDEKYLHSNPDQAVFDAHLAAARLTKEGRFDDATDILAATSNRLSVAGQTIQAANVWNKTTPEGFMLMAQRTAEGGRLNKKAELATEDLQKKVQGKQAEVEKILAETRPEEEPVTLDQAVDRFKRQPKPTPEDYTYLAKNAYRMSQTMSESAFEKALAKLTQKELDEIGARFGC